MMKARLAFICVLAPAVALAGDGHLHDATVTHFKDSSDDRIVKARVTSDDSGSQSGPHGVRFGVLVGDPPNEEWLEQWDTCSGSNCQYAFTINCEEHIPREWRVDFWESDPYHPDPAQQPTGTRGNQLYGWIDNHADIWESEFDHEGDAQVGASELKDILSINGFHMSIDDKDGATETPYLAFQLRANSGSPMALPVFDFDMGDYLVPSSVKENFEVFHKIFDNNSYGAWIDGLYDPGNTDLDQYSSGYHTGRVMIYADGMIDGYGNWIQKADSDGPDMGM